MSKIGVGDLVMPNVDVGGIGVPLALCSGPLRDPADPIQYTVVTFLHDGDLCLVTMTEGNDIHVMSAHKSGWRETKYFSRIE